MSGVDFENYVAAKFRSGGYRVSMTRTTGDFGVDPVARKGKERIAVQCKRHGRPVGTAAVQQVVSGAAMHRCTQLHDREALLPNERQRRFVESEGWIAWPAPALADALRQFIAQNRMLSGGMVIDGRPLTLADVDRPVLCFVGENDKIGQPQAVRAIRRAAPRADIHEVSLPVGHLGIVVGSVGNGPNLAGGCRLGIASRQRFSGEMPAEHRADGQRTVEGRCRRRTSATRSSQRWVRDCRPAGDLGAATLDATWALTAGAATNLPRLLRLELVRPRRGCRSAAFSTNAPKGTPTQSGSCGRTAPTLTPL